MTLPELERLARHEVAQLRYPPPNWVLPRNAADGRAMLDVLVVGGGMCGQTATFALLREGVTNVRCLDRAARGAEGPWTTFARMDILRSPKHLTGPDLGIASLTYRAYHEAKFGLEDWERLHKIDRVEWARYLMWVRETVGIPVENGIAVRTIDLVPGAVRVSTANETLQARKVVLAMGREGTGALRWPAFATFHPARRSPGVYHSADDIDFAALKGEHAFDAVIVCTGFDVNLMDRPEIAPIREAIETWREHVSAAEVEKFPEEARFPYLGDAFQLRGRHAELGRVHVFNWGSTMSHGALAGDIPGLETGARRLATGIVRDLFLEDADRHWEGVQVHNEDELKPTRYFVPLDKRK